MRPAAHNENRGLSHTPLPADTACSEAQQESGSARLSNRCGPSADFIRRTRNPDLEPPEKVERTAKGPKDIVI
jgi:hypothetical protein